VSKSNDHSAPVLPLRDVVVYPYMAIPLFVGREKSVRALTAAMQDDKRILLIAQRVAETDDPGVDDLYTMGTLATILQLLKLPDGTVKVLVEGAQRARLTQLHGEGDYLTADFESVPADENSGDAEGDAIMRAAVSTFEQYVKLNKKVPAELLPSLSSIDAPGRLADAIAAHLSLKLDEKQRVLEVADPRERLEHVLAQLEAEIDVLQVEKKIRGRVKAQRTDESHPERAG
jgi:ATP-dependent Lon protease